MKHFYSYRLLTLSVLLIACVDCAFADGVFKIIEGMQDRTLKAKIE